MPERTSYVQGTPNWVDLQTTDQDGAKAFYGHVFGWTYDDAPFPEGAGVYSMAQKGGGLVAAITAQTPELAAQNIPPMWNTYLAVDDVDDVTTRVEPAGGKVAMGPFDVMDSGRMSFVLDPTGAPVGLWQADQHIGATFVNEPGAVVWNDLSTDDPDKAAAFFATVLGLEPVPDDSDGEPYISLKAAGTVVGGISRPQAEGTPNSWHVYFAVDDAPTAIAKAESAGGSVVVGPLDTPFGVMATIRDPQGAFFSVIAVAPTTEAE